MLEQNPQLLSKVFASVFLHMKEDRDGRHSHKKSGSTTWSRLASDLNEIGLTKAQTDSLVNWSLTQADQSRKTPAKLRILHPMEREFISVEAFDYLLVLYRLGLLDPAQLENLLESCAYLTNLPATRDQVRKIVLKMFSEVLDSAGMGSSH